MRHWSLIGKFGAVQLLVQAIGALSSLLIVRHLTKQDYALFTITNTMQSTMNLLADSGVSVALMAVGGALWQDPKRMGQLVHTALRIRRRMAMVAAAAVLPVLLWLATRNGASVGYALVLATAAVVGLNFQLGYDVHVVVPRLHSQIARLQKLDLGVAAIRLVLIAAMTLLFLNAGVAVWVTVVGSAWLAVTTARWAREMIDANAPASEEYRREVTRKIRHMLPSALFYCVQGQVLVFLVSFSGHSGQVAEVGALGRLTVLLNIVAPIMTGIILPAFSRSQTRATLVRRYALVLGGFSLLCGALVLAALIFSEPLLWLLGPQYAGLSSLLVLMTFNAALNVFTGTMWSLNAAKGWIEHLWIEIPLRLTLQFALVFVFDITTVEGAVWFTICSQASPILVNTMLTFRGLRAATAN